MTAIAHYLRRAGELGLAGSLRRAEQRLAGAWTTWSQALWWRVAARRQMSDAALLARTAGHWPTVDALLAHLAARPGSSFLLPHDTPAELARLFRRHYPERVAALVAGADAIAGGRIRLLGHDIDFDGDVDWHGETITGWAWPLLHRGRLNRRVWSGETPADPILTWELNRHQHLAALGIAHWLTGEDRYVEAFVDQVRGWLEANPVQHGINWLYALEVAVRLVAWTVAFQFFRQAEGFRRHLGADFLKSLHQQADFVAEHLQTKRSRVPNNHLVAEATALAVVGACFPEFRAAAGWRETGQRLLAEQAAAQVHPDGVHMEQAIGYHRFVTELLLVVVGLGRRGVLPRVAALEDTVARMLDYVCHTQTPSGGVPFWGDADYARMPGIRQDEDFWDFGHLLAVGAALFGRPDWKWVAGEFGEEAFWLLGADGLARWEELDAHPPRETGRAFPDAGVYVQRSAWAADADVAFFRCGPFGLGPAGPCSHAHADLLSPIVWLGGRELLVDSGTYTYHGPWRDPFRLTAAHNTLMVDGTEQATPLPHFGWTDLPRARCEDWDVDRVAGALEAAPGVWHRREVVRPRPGRWDVVDHVTGAGVHTLTWYFHFAQDLALQPADGASTLLVTEADRPFAQIQTPPGVRFEISRACHSVEYGRRQPNPRLKATWRGEIPAGGVRFAWSFRHAEKVREEST